MSLRELNVESTPIVSMLSPEVAGKLNEFHLRWRFQDARCLLTNDDDGPQGLADPILPYAPATRSRVFTGTRQTGSYNHHSQITRFRDRYYMAWSNGIVNEEDAGQRVLIASSPNTRDWSEPICIAGDTSSALAHNCLALYASETALHVFAMSEEVTRDAQAAGMRRIDPETTDMTIYRSTDGVSWETAFSFGNEIRWFFEAPRFTADGLLLCSMGPLKAAPAFALWDGPDVCRRPEIVAVPRGDGNRFWHAEGTWYQTDDGRIFYFWRDEGGSCRVWLTISDDGGRTFSPMQMTDIPDSMSRLYAGRLDDGRFYLCNNAFPTLLDRRHLTLLVSDDGYVFNSVSLVIDDPTSQRLRGLLKADGYQYPCCLTEPGRLVIAYSVNKEDIECATVETAAI